MSHAPDSVEDLLNLAYEAVDRDDYARAIGFVRRAHELAPMRSDIKSLLASLLEMSDTASGDPVTYREGRCGPAAPTSAETAEPERTKAFSLGQTSSFGVGEFVRTGPDWCRPAMHANPEDDLDPIETAEDNNNDFASQVAARLRETRFQSPAEDERDAPKVAPKPRIRVRSADAPSSDLRASLAVSEQVTTDFRPDPQVVASSPKRASVSKRDFEKVETDPDVSVVRRPLLARVPGRYFAAVLVYGFIIVFVAAAGAVGHFRLARGLRAERISSQRPSETSPAGGESRGSPRRTEQEIIRLAEDYTRSKRFDDAIALLAPSGDLGSEATLGAAARQVLARAHEGKATDLLQKNLVEASVVHYRKAAELNPDSPTAKLLLGNALYFCGLAYDRNSKEAKRFFTDALKAVNESLELDRENLQAYERLASVYQALQQNAQARAALDKIVQIAPASPAATRAQDQIRALSMSK